VGGEGRREGEREGRREEGEWGCCEGKSGRWWREGY
jgi:hypothetical protein